MLDRWQEINDGTPKTIKDAMIKHLIINGMTVTQSDEVFERFKKFKKK